ncbi:hypothetical protein DFQ28_004868 [Apophysomyces sp. BC1034]|nr:hypothetical protein DFQ29_003814 [Apophysomyces sp. BC1021]KAG0188434.1 hypothetical protein DFQ28_004868 [Apophysomyces sp. BC1034]
MATELYCENCGTTLRYCAGRSRSGKADSEHKSFAFDLPRLSKKRASSTPTDDNRDSDAIAGGAEVHSQPVQHLSSQSTRETTSAPIFGLGDRPVSPIKSPAREPAVTLGPAASQPLASRPEWNNNDYRMF